MTADYKLHTLDNEKIFLTAYENQNQTKENIIIFVHGFKGFKDWGFGPFMGEYLSGRGFYVLTFNFSHNGVKGSSDEFTEPDKFARNTFTRELSELNEIIDACLAGEFGIKRVKHLGLLGHSRGGAIALLAASRRIEVDAVVTWSAVSKFDRYSQRQKSLWQNQGYFTIMNSRTGQEMRLDVSLLEDIIQNGEGTLNLKVAAKRLNKPWLIIHGNQDIAVPVQEGKKLYEWSEKKRTNYLEIKSTGHTFDIKHPFEGTNAKFKEVLDQTGNFLKLQFSM